MNRMLVLTPIVLAGVLVARRLLSPEQRDHLSRLPATMLRHCMERMPEDFPPKMMMASLRRIQAQNDEILVHLQELVRVRRASAGRKPPPEAP